MRSLAVQSRRKDIEMAVSVKVGDTNLSASVQSSLMVCIVIVPGIGLPVVGDNIYLPKEVVMERGEHFGKRVLTI